MNEAKHGDVDVLKELRLRRWARQHYVPPERRAENWHPIVLEEMRARDAELGSAVRNESCSVYVPLMPSDHRRLEPAHGALARPKLLPAPEVRPARSRQRSSL